MNFIEANMYAIQQAIRDVLPGNKLDEHWERVLPEALDFAKNEIFLTLHRLYINESMKQNAARIAQTIPPRDIGDKDDATLMVHCIARMYLLRMSNNTEFQTLVDQSRSIIYDTTDSVVLVKPSRIWLPHSDRLARQLFLSLVERYKQVFFAQRCYQHCVNELMRLAQKNQYIKPTFILLSDTHGMHREQKEALHLLRNVSSSIAASIGLDRDVAEDVLQDYLKKILALPLHLQMKRCGATGKAIKDGVIDIKRQASRYEHVYLNDERHSPDELLNPNTDELIEAPSDRMIADEIPQRVLERQTQIEEILSQGRPEKRKQGERRFKVIQLLAHTPNLTSSAIANQLRTSEPTISRDRRFIEQNRDRIEQILYG